MPDGTSPTSFASATDLLNDNAPALRPGERMVAGKPHIFDLDAVTAFNADMRLATMPMDLSRLIWSELANCHAAWLNADRRCGGDPLVAALGRRICDERAKRPEHAASFGRRS